MNVRESDTENRFKTCTCQFSVNESLAALEVPLLENAVSVGVARRHSEGGVSLVGGVGGQVLTQRYCLLQLGGDGRRRRTRQSVTWRETRPELTTVHRHSQLLC